MYPGNLPFDPNQPNQQAFIQGLPYSVPGRNPPNGFPAQLGPDAFRMMDGYLRYNLQEQAGRNPLRMFLFNQMSSNFYNNQFYEEMLISAGTFLELVMASGSYNTGNMEGAVKMVAEKMTSIYASINATQYPPLQQMVQDPNIVNSVNNTLNEFEQIKQQILNYQRSQQGNNWGGNQQQNWQGGGFQQNWQGGGNSYAPRQSTWQGGNSGYQQPTQTSTGGRSMFSGGYQQPNKSVVDTGRRGGMHNFQEVDVGKPESHDVPNTTQSDGYGFNRNKWDMAAPETTEVKTNVKFDNEPVTYDDPLYYTSIPDHLALVATLPENLVHNPNTHERIYLPSKEGQLVEVIQEKGEFMDYEQHELDNALKTQNLGAPSPSPQGDGWDNYHYINASATILTDESEEDEVTPAVQLNNLIDAHSDQQAEFYLRQALIKKRLKVPEDAILEFQYRQVKPIAYRVDRVGADMLAKVSNVAEFIETMNDLDMPERFCGQITKRTVTMINDALLYSMSIGWTIDGLGDYPDLLKEIAGEYGEHTKQQFDKKINDLIPLMFSAITATDVSKYLQETYNAERLKDNIVQVAEDTELSGFVENIEDPDVLDLTTEDYAVVFLTDIISITQVPWNLKSMELGLDKEKPTAAIKQSVNPVEFKVIQDLFARTKDLNVRHYFIDTIDGYRLKVLPGWLSKDYYALGLWRE